MATTTDSTTSSLLNKAHPFRRVIREVLAMTFLFHSLFVFRYIPSLFAGLGSLPRYAYYVALLGFIFYYSVFSDSGWLSVIWDLVFVYIYPFILLRRAVWGTSKFTYQFFKTHTKSTKLNLIVADKVAASSAAKPLFPEKASFPTVTKAKPSRRAIAQKLFVRPFRQFVVLWAILSLSVNNKVFVAFACCVALWGAARALWNLRDLLSETSNWTAQLGSNLASQIASQINEVRTWEEGRSNDKATNSVNTLKFWESSVAFIDDNRFFLSRCTWVAAVMLSIPFYLYISFLFSCVYFGVARLEGVSFPWLNALSDSLFIPFAFTDLPRAFGIRLVAGLHAIAISILGWNLLTRHLGEKFNQLALVATEMRSPFADDVLRKKIRHIEIASRAKQETAASQESESNTEDFRARSVGYVSLLCDGQTQSVSELSQATLSVSLVDTQQFFRADVSIENFSMSPVIISPSSFFGVATKPEQTFLAYVAPEQIVAHATTRFSNPSGRPPTDDERKNFEASVADVLFKSLRDVCILPGQTISGRVYFQRQTSADAITLHLTLGVDTLELSFLASGCHS